jgi:cysteine desulfurase
MRVPETALRGGVRFSLSRDNTAEEVDRALEIVPDVLIRLRAMTAPRVREATSSALDRANA